MSAKTPGVAFHRVRKWKNGYTKGSYLQFNPPSPAGQEKKWPGPVPEGVIQNRTGNYQPLKRYW